MPDSVSSKEAAGKEWKGGPRRVFECKMTADCHFISMSKMGLEVHYDVKHKKKPYKSVK